MTEKERIVVTGAAGRLGRFVVKRLIVDYPDLVATDRAEALDLPVAYRSCDLRDHAAVSGLLQGVSAVVHLGNHPGLRHPATTFNENVTMNMNVFQGAAEQGVGRIVFASTIQLIGTHVDRKTVMHPPEPPTFPINETTQARPANAYALSKTVSETMLRYFADRCGLSCVAIRFPIIDAGTLKVDLPENRIDPTVVWEGFGCISAQDGAELVASVLRSDLPGFRIYSPGVSGRCRDVPLATLIERHYPEVSPSLPSLIDNATITRETGWRPRDFLY